jgi:TatD DNase family protein
MHSLKPLTATDFSAAANPALDLVDTHNHLGLEPFADDRDVVFARAQALGVRQMLLIGAGSGLAGNRQTVELARGWPGAHAAIGIHPHEANLWSAQTAQALVELLEANLTVIKAIGETGFDHHYRHCEIHEEHFACEAQFALAERYSLPVIIHTRLAHQDTVSMLRKHSKHVAQVGAVIHCFSEGIKEASAYLELGAYLSFSGIITFPTADEIREAMRITPRNRILIETDAPYLAPRPFRGRRNEPACLATIIAFAAEVLEQTPQELAALSSVNARSLFNIGAP